MMDLPTSELLINVIIFISSLIVLAAAALVCTTLTAQCISFFHSVFHMPLSQNTLTIIRNAWKFAMRTFISCHTRFSNQNYYNYQENTNSIINKEIIVHIKLE